jgi:transposase
MAYREVDMWEILEVLRQIGRGESISAVHRATGRDRKTIRRYVELAGELGWDRERQEPTEELAGAIQRRLRPVPDDARPGPAEAILGPHREQIRQWLDPGPVHRGLQLSKVLKLLRRQGVEVPYSSLHRFAVKHCGFADRRRVTVRMADCAPGELAEVDFGRLGLVWDPVLERQRVLHALVVTLVHSRHQYVHACHGQRLRDVITGLEEAWEFFGGVPARVVVDNLKPAVTKADRYDPVFQRTFGDYAQYRGFVIDAAVVREPKHKPHVERQMPYVRENFFRGEAWLHREHVQRAALQWCLEEAGMRIHGTTRKRPLQVFESIEQPALQPLEKPRYDTPDWADCKVHPDHHVCFGKAIYSVPTDYLGKTATVRGDSKLVRIYVGGDLIKTHPRQRPGGRSTDYNDYPKEKVAYAMRDPDRCVRAAQQKGPDVGRFAQQLLGGDFPWAYLRQAQKLLRLCDKYGAARVDAACARAVAFDLINVRRVENIVKQNLDAPLRPAGTDHRAQVAQLPLRFAREAGAFTHDPIQGGSRD